MAAILGPGMRRERKLPHADPVVHGEAERPQEFEQSQGPRKAIRWRALQINKLLGARERPHGGRKQLVLGAGSDRLGALRSR